MSVTTVYELARQPGPNDHLIAGYIPRLYLAIIAIAFYGVTTIILWTHWFKQGKQRWILALTIGSLCMTIGYCVRIGMYADPYSLTTYIVSTLFTLLSPCAFLATDYMALGRLSLYLGSDVTSRCLLLRANLIAKLYVASDIITFLIQAAGGAMTASGQNNPSMGEIGEKVSMVGLSLQCAAFASYTAILLLFGYRVRTLFPEKWNAGQIHQNQQAPRAPLWKFWDRTPILDWRILFFSLCITCLGFLTRSAFRVAEFSGGYTGHLYTTEGYFYGLDALPLWLAINVFVFIWPPRFMKFPELFADSAASDEPKTVSPAGSVGGGAAKVEV